MRIRRAFTLMELLIVIIVVAILAAIALPKFIDSGVRSKEAALRADLRLVREALRRCQADTGLMVRPDALTSATPPAQGQVEGPMGTGWVTKSVNPADWHGPYLDAMPIDPFTGAADWEWNSLNTDAIDAFHSSAVRVALDGTKYVSW